MSRLWGWIVASFTLLGAALLLVIGQRNKARDKAKAARVAVQTSEANREADHAARKAQEAARQQSEGVQREADERPDDNRPTGTFRR